MNPSKYYHIWMVLCTLSSWRSFLSQQQNRTRAYLILDCVSLLLYSGIFLYICFLGFCSCFLFRHGRTGVQHVRPSANFFLKSTATVGSDTPTVVSMWFVSACSALCEIERLGLLTMMIAFYDRNSKHGDVIFSSEVSAVVDAMIGVQ